MYYASASTALFALCAVTNAAIPDLTGTQWGSPVFADDFTGAANTLPDSTKWKIDVGTSYPGGPVRWGTNESETDTRSTTNIRQSGQGGLWIIPVRGADGTWTSARVETKRANFLPPAGRKMRMEAGIRMPAVTPTNGLGYWPAFFTLGANLRQNYNNWPAVGEFDIMENINALSSINYGLHCGTNPGGACNEPSGLTQRTSCPNSNCNGNWHSYTVVLDRSITPEALRFYIDDQLQKTITADQVGSATWSGAVDHGMFMVLNVAIGGAYPDAVAGTTTPTAQTISGAEMRIDYVGVWYSS